MHIFLIFKTNANCFKAEILRETVSKWKNRLCHRASVPSGREELPVTPETPLTLTPKRQPLVRTKSNFGGKEELNKVTMAPRWDCSYLHSHCHLRLSRKEHIWEMGAYLPKGIEKIPHPHYKTIKPKGSTCRFIRLGEKAIWFCSLFFPPILYLHSSIY